MEHNNQFIEDNLKKLEILLAEGRISTAKKAFEIAAICGEIMFPKEQYNDLNQYVRRAFSPEAYAFYFIGIGSGTPDYWKIPKSDPNPVSLKNIWGERLHYDVEPYVLKTQLREGLSFEEIMKLPECRKFVALDFEVRCRGTRDDASLRDPTVEYIKYGDYFIREKIHTKATELLNEYSNNNCFRLC